MTKGSRSLIREERKATATGAIIIIVEKLVTQNYKRVEQAARSGILQMLVAFNFAKGDLPDLISGSSYSLLLSLSRFLSFYSVIEAFSTQMRQLTDGKHPKETSMLKGPLAGAWHFLKGRLLERYCIARMFETFVGGQRVIYCFNVSFKLDYLSGYANDS